MKSGLTVLVLGCGLSGILHIQMARILGAQYIVATDINDYRLRLGREFGADLVLHADDNIAERLKAVNHGRLADLVIICTGVQQAVDQGFHLVERGGTILLFAPPMPDEMYPVSPYTLWKEGITLTTSYEGSPADIQEAIRIISSRQILVSDMITHRCSLAETGLGFQLTSQAQNSLKVIIEPQR
jgi:L-iditol 2-dehydrogenase